MIIRRPHQQKFTIIDNQAIHDVDLSLKATGLLCYLLSLPPNWDISGRALANMKKDGRDAVYSGLKELEEAGYVQRYHESVYDGTNLSETGKDRGHVVECCDVTERPHDFEVPDSPPVADNPPPEDDPIFETPAGRDDVEDAETPLAENPDGGKNRITEEPNYGKSSHNKVLSLQSTISTKDKQLAAPAHEEEPEDLTPDPSPYVQKASPKQRELIKKQLAERDVAKELRHEIDEAWLKLSSRDASRFIQALDASPKQNPHNQPVRSVPKLDSNPGPKIPVQVENEVGELRVEQMTEDRFDRLLREIKRNKRYGSATPVLVELCGSKVYVTSATLVPANGAVEAEAAGGGAS
jgi:hypothetical protein